jgi:hypothetical protein
MDDERRRQQEAQRQRRAVRILAREKNLRRLMMVCDDLTA